MMKWFAHELSPVFPSHENTLCSSREAACADHFRLIMSPDAMPPDAATPGGATAAGLEAEKVFRSLSGWVGIDGCHALFTRARAQETAKHPPLELLQLTPRAKQYLTGIPEAGAIYGDDATVNAIKSMLSSTVSLLDRLIGGDMAARLMERELPESEQHDSTSKQRSTET